MPALKLRHLKDSAGSTGIYPVPSTLLITIDEQDGRGYIGLTEASGGIQKSGW